MESIEVIIREVLTELYSYAFASVIFAFLFWHFEQYLKEHGAEKTFKTFFRMIREESKNRWRLAFYVYLAMVLFRTLLNRFLWQNTIANVIGKWGLYNADGTIYTENIENAILFIPLSFLFLKVFADQISRNKLRTTLFAIAGFSFSIEFLQLFFRLGEFQLSDLAFNTFGGVVGGLIYYVYSALRKRKKGTKYHDKKEN